MAGRDLQYPILQYIASSCELIERTHPDPPGKQSICIYLILKSVVTRGWMPTWKADMYIFVNNRSVTANLVVLNHLTRPAIHMTPVETVIV